MDEVICLRSPGSHNYKEGRYPGVRHLGVSLSRGFVRMRLADRLEDQTERPGMGLLHAPH